MVDATNLVPVTDSIQKKMAKQRHFPVSDLAAQCYAIVCNFNYYFWDVFTTAFVCNPKLFRTAEAEVDVCTEGKSEGKIFRKVGGRKVTEIVDVDVNEFYEYILKQWQL